MERSVRLMLLQGVALTALLTGLPASAEVSSTKPAPAASDKLGQIEEITVTATRRSERMQDVPIAISAITADTAERLGVTGINALQTTVPSLVMSHQANGLNPYLRGVGFNNGDANGEGSVAIYVDGVYQPVPMGNVFEFNNIERVEVLKGPQGTLFGRNATGGVIQVITKDPSFAPQVSASVGYEKYNRITGNIYGSVGLTDTIAVNLAIRYDHQNDGWGTNLVTGKPTFLSKDFNARSKLLIKPDESTKILITGDYSYGRGAGIGEQPMPGAINAAGQGYPGKYNQLNNFESGSYGRDRGVALRIDHDFGAVQLVSISAYRKHNTTWMLDQDMSPVNIISATLTQNARTISQEIHLLAPTDAKFQWLVGGYYFNHKAGQQPENLAGIGPGIVFGAPALQGINIFAETEATSFAVFAQGTYPLTDTVNLTVGGRYTVDRSHYTGQLLGNFGGGYNVPLIPVNTGRLAYEKPTWRVALDHKFTPDILGYISYNRGVKSGNFTVSNPVATSYNPEQLDAYETGLKTEILDRHVRLNLAGFYYDYKNIQFQRIDQGAAVIFNGPSAKTYGVEIEIEARATENLTFNANGGLLHTKIGNFPNAPATIRLPNGFTAPNVGFNAEGNSTPNSPKFSGNASVSYRIPSTVGEFDLSGNVYYTTKYYTEIDNRLYNSSFALLNASLNWTDPSNKYNVRVWGKNLTNHYYYLEMNGQAPGTDLGGPAAPRTYGVTLGFKFE